MTARVPVSEGTRVFLNFALSLDRWLGGRQSNFSGDPVDFVVGDGSLLPGFERLLFGMCAGERQFFTVDPEQAFGQARDENVQRLPRDRFDADTELEIGLIYSFADPAGGELPGLVVEFDEKWVTVDFNHPLVRAYYTYLMCWSTGSRQRSCTDPLRGNVREKVSATVRMANPRGFCAGVDRAIDIVNRALEVFGAPIYVRHEVVHNKFVVDDLRQRGAVFVDELDESARRLHRYFQRPRGCPGGSPGSGAALA